jgi:hypothetical protein
MAVSALVPVAMGDGRTNRAAVPPIRHAGYQRGPSSKSRRRVRRRRLSLNGHDTQPLIILAVFREQNLKLTGLKRLPRRDQRANGFGKRVFSSLLALTE